jgi:hypothetical protein
MMARFTVRRGYDGKWMVTDTESKGGVLMFCRVEKEAREMLIVLNKEFPPGASPANGASGSRLMG